MHLRAIQTHFQVVNPFLAQIRRFSYIGARGAGRKIGFLPISREVSQLGHMLLHKLYINLAIWSF